MPGVASVHLDFGTVIADLYRVGEGKTVGITLCYHVGCTMPMKAPAFHARQAIPGPVSFSLSGSKSSNRPIDLICQISPASVSGA